MINKKAKRQLVDPEGGAQVARPSGGGGRGGYSGKSKRSERQTEAVRTMQLVMGKLQSALGTSAGAEKAATLIEEGMDAKAIMDYGRGFGGTSAGGNSGSYDGIWGRNTKKALGRIVAFLKAANISGVLIQPGKGTSPAKEMEDAELIRVAESNITNLGRIFTKVGASAPSEIGSRGGSDFIFDMIESDLATVMSNNPDPWPEHRGNISVTAGEIRDIVQFISFIQRLTFTNCKPLPEKKEASDAATMILEGALFSFAAEPEDSDTDAVSAARGGAAGGARVGAASAAAVAQNREKAEATEEEVRTSGTGPCFSSVDDFISWFDNRSFYVFNQLRTAAQDRRPHPVPDTNGDQRAITQSDLTNAKKYNDAIKNLRAQWDAVKRSVEGVIREDGNAKNPRVTRDVLMRALREGGMLGGQAARTGRGRGGGGRSGDGRSVSRGRDRGLEGPIQDSMRLSRVDEDHPYGEMDELEALSKEGRLPYLNRRSWRGRSWTSFAKRYIDKPTEAEQLRAFPAYADALTRYLQSLYRNWESQDDIVDDEVPIQERNLGRWEQSIRSQRARAMDTMAAAVGEANRVAGVRENTGKRRV